MGVPEAVLSKVGSLPDVASMNKDDLTALCKQLYERSCVAFGEKFDEEYLVRKRDMEIHNLEMETSESHGTFKIPKLKKVKLLLKGIAPFKVIIWLLFCCVLEVNHLVGIRFNFHRNVQLPLDIKLVCIYNGKITSFITPSK